ncbi:aminotransferase class III-fold pyridoxal phosphate-dependent enzyme [Microbacterium stercoris]|uniref:aminotransferase class III-fold pyridoxal phosphate-dependent enzyme n=1 Tax=Microbacterium stercoris TaxID=2820289 RepID=UPI00355714FE
MLSKALTNGTSAASAVLLASSVGGVLRRHDDVFWHGETQAGSPQSCAAILATIDELERIGAQSLADSLSTVMDEELNALAGLSTRIVASGRGLMRALHLTHADGSALDASEVFDLVRSCLRDGVIVQPAPSALQFMPALIFDRAQLAEVFGRVRPTLERFLASAA